MRQTRKRGGAPPAFKNAKPDNLKKLPKADARNFIRTVCTKELPNYLELIKKEQAAAKMTEDKKQWADVEKDFTAECATAERLKLIKNIPASTKLQPEYVKTTADRLILNRNDGTLGKVVPPPPPPPPPPANAKAAANKAAANKTAKAAANKNAYAKAAAKAAANSKGGPIVGDPVRVASRPSSLAAKAAANAKAKADANAKAAANAKAKADANAKAKAAAEAKAVANAKAAKNATAKANANAKAKAAANATAKAKANANAKAAANAKAKANANAKAAALKNQLKKLNTRSKLSSSLNNPNGSLKATTTNASKNLTSMLTNAVFGTKTTTPGSGSQIEQDIQKITQNLQAAKQVLTNMTKTSSAAPAAGGTRKKRYGRNKN